MVKSIKKVFKIIGIIMGIIFILFIALMILAYNVGSKTDDKFTEEEIARMDEAFDRDHAIRDAAKIVADDRDSTDARKKYKFQSFAEVPGNPAYLFACVNSSDLSYNDSWSFKTGDWSSISFKTTTEQSKKLNEIIKSDDVVMLLYQRHGSYTDINEILHSSLATTSQSDINKVQNILSSYTFSVDTILNYNFWFDQIHMEISNDIRNKIFSEERRPRNQNGWKILDTYYNEGATVAIAYIEQRVSEIQNIPLPVCRHQDYKRELVSAKQYLREQYPYENFKIPYYNLTTEDIKE